MKNQVYYSRTKHIEVRFCFIRKIMDGDDILLKKISDVDIPVNILTKVMSGANFQHC